MNTSTSPVSAPATSASNKTLWAAIAVLGVAVLAMGATLIRIQSQPTEPRMAVLPAPSAPAETAASAPALPSLTAAPAPLVATSSKPLATHNNQANSHTSHNTALNRPQTSMPNKPLAPVKQAQSTPYSGATEVFEPSASPRAVQPRNPEPAVARAPEAPLCQDCGTVESITPVDVEGAGSGTGALAGGVLGAVVGNQVGDGNGKVLATILGAVGGGMAGNSVEKKMKKTTFYDVSVRMDDGSHRLLRQTVPAAVGSLVRVQGSSVLPR